MSIPTSMSNRKRSSDTLEVPQLTEGDPTLEYKTVFGKISEGNGELYYDVYEHTFKMEKSGKTEFVTLKSYTKHVYGVWRGDHGTCHRYLVDGVLIESKNTWFVHESSFENLLTPVGVEQEIREEDDHKVHFLSVKNGKLVDQETREREEKEFEESKKQDEELMERVKYWLPNSCHPSIIAFRKNYKGHAPGVCNCGVVHTERRVKKKTSNMYGKTFFGCSLFPNGCSYFKRA
jgi:hypothetical protein